MNTLIILSLFLIICNSLYAQDTELRNQEKDSKLLLSAYGEIGASFRNYTGNNFDTAKGVEAENSTTGRVPGIGFNAEYEFSHKWKAKCNAEFISGAGIQLDNFSLTHNVKHAFNVTAGLFELPIGHCNSDYGYLDYFHTGDPEGEYALIPYPMTELGVALSGDLKWGLCYHASVTTGLNAAKFSTQSWIACSSQAFNMDEANFSSPAYTFRLGYNGLKNFQMSAGLYYSPNTIHNSTFYHDYKEYCKEKFNGLKKTPVTIWYADAEYANNYVTFRGSYLQGNLNNAAYLTKYYKNLQEQLTEEELEYKNGTIAKGAIALMGEIGLNIRNCFYAESDGPEIYPFVHYEYYDSQHKADNMTGTDKDPRGKVHLWSFGLNWKPIKEVVVKCNYTKRNIGNGRMNPANEINLAIAYNFDIL